ncbi:TRAP transporter small permease [Halocella sp. SP3-1]|uniref:TRAP transporter small permease n=1 Tax=Halocella sp. SP3-1 TaxID=2382161 RepID=UPI000F76368F|nr:TRAP transporter small permease [Halocella sp. SP3-1]AZO96376.1 TRAP transporter small permease [Halocella sp. SP3-1]
MQSKDIPSIINYIIKLSNFLEKILKLFLILIVSVMTVIVISNVLARNLINYSPYWADEISRYLMIYMIYFGAAVALKNEELVGVNFFLKKVPAIVMKVMTFIALICIFFFNSYIFYHSVFLIRGMVDSGHLSAQLMIPMWIIYLVIPVGFLFLSFFTITLLLEKIYGFRDWTVKLAEQESLIEGGEK